MISTALLPLTVAIITAIQTLALEYTHSCTRDFHYERSLDRNATCAGITRLDGVRVGHVQRLTIFHRHYNVHTRSLKPLVFQIPNFLSDEECKNIMKAAMRQGLTSSKTISEEISPRDMDSRLIEILKKRYLRVGKRFGNRFTSLGEFQDFLHQNLAFYPYMQDALEIFRQFDANSDKSISEMELISAPEETLEKFVSVLEKLKRRPRYRARFSDQTWLQMNKTGSLSAVRDRIINLTRLPRWVVETSEPLQVVRYPVNGHFHGHYDSTEDDVGRDLQCCHGYEMEGCHLCRFLTILFYLNDVTQGGETAFLVAGSKSISNGTSPDLSAHCNMSRLLIAPKRGTAVLWYNHFLDKTTGLLGNLDKFSLHGGCDVIKGTKWIANSWVNIPKGDWGRG